MDIKARENRLRRNAQRIGLRFEKARMDRPYIGRARYYLIDEENTVIESTEAWGDKGVAEMENALVRKFSDLRFSRNYERAVARMLRP